MKVFSRWIFPILVVAWIVAWVCGIDTRDRFLKPGQHGEALRYVGLNRVVPQKTEPPSKRGKYGGVMTDTTLGDPKTFNLWAATDAGSGGAVGLLYDSLIGQNTYTQQWEGRLCDLPNVSKDGLVWTFRLKPNLTWSDGVPITADDIIFTLDMIFDPKTQGTVRETMLVDVKDPKTGQYKRVPPGYQKIDDRTVQFRFPVPYAPARSMLSINVAPRHKLYAAWKSGQFNSTWSVSTAPKELVSSGPWIMQSYVASQRLVYVRNPHYWKKDKWGGALPYLDKYVQLIVPDTNTDTLKFKAGECDALGVTATDYPSIKRSEPTGNYTIYDLGPSSSTQYLGFNLNPNSKTGKTAPWKIKLFQQTKFRQAVSYAINRDLMCINQFLGLAQPLYTFITPADKIDFNPNTPKYPYNPKKAQALLDSIGAKDNDGNGYREFEGHEIQFNIITGVQNQQRKDMCTVITKDLKNVGLNAIFTPVDFNRLISSLDSPPYDWEAVVLGFTGGGSEPNDSANIWYSSSLMHQWNPNQKTPATPWEAEVDDLFRQGAQELDPKKRKAIYDRWQVIASTQLPLIYTVVPDSIVAVRNKFGNLKPCPGGALWNQDELYDLSATRDTP